MSKVGQPLMGDTAGMPCEPIETQRLNSISSGICQQNAHFSMYSTTSKPQEGSTCKYSLPKCFITTNSTAKLSRGAVNRGEVLRTCFHLNFYTSIKQYILLC